MNDNIKNDNYRRRSAVISITKKYIASIALPIILILASVLTPITAFAAGTQEKEDVTITIDSTDYEYDPSGIEALFTCVPATYASSAEIEFISADDPSIKIAVSHGEKAALEVGDYTLSIIVKEGIKNNEAYFRETIHVSPATVSIVTYYNKVAYTDMDNPPDYFIANVACDNYL